MDFLDSLPSVDGNRKMGTMGYCMGGPITMRTAAAVPDRIGAGASFHGGGLVTDRPDSPHLLVPKMRAHYLFAIAENDDERQPEAKNVLRDAFAQAGLPAEIEVYEGALHGRCPPDTQVYNEAQAERAWSRLLALFERARLTRAHRTNRQVSGTPGQGCTYSNNSSNRPPRWNGTLPLCLPNSGSPP